MIVTTSELFQQAYGKYAVGAYNINNLEQTVGLFRGNLGLVKSNDDPVDASKSAPFIIQLSRGARGYTDKRFLEAMTRDTAAVFCFPIQSLSDRELEVFELIGQGNSNQEIAELLHIRPRTVNAHQGNIRDKLKFRSSSDLLAHAVKWVESGECKSVPSVPGGAKV